MNNELSVSGSLDRFRANVHSISDLILLASAYDSLDERRQASANLDVDELEAIGKEASTPGHKFRGDAYRPFLEVAIGEGKWFAMIDELRRLQEANQRLASVLRNAWVDYDQTPFQMASEQHDAMPYGVLKVCEPGATPASRYQAGGEVILYRLSSEAVNKIGDGRYEDWYATSIRLLEEIRELEANQGNDVGEL